VKTAIEISGKVKFDTLIHLATILRERWRSGAIHNPVRFADAIQGKRRNLAAKLRLRSNFELIADHRRKDLSRVFGVGRSNPTWLQGLNEIPVNRHARG